MIIPESTIKLTYNNHDYLLTYYEYLLTNPYHDIKLNYTEDGIIKWFEISLYPILFEKIFNQLELKYPPSFEFYTQKTYRLTDFMKSIISIIRSSIEVIEEFGNGLLVGTAITELATLLLKEYPNTIQKLENLEMIKKDTRIQQAIEFIKSNFNNKISLKDIAKEVAVSERRLLQLFQSEFRKSPITYLIEYRIQKAIEMLKDPLKSIEEIAETTGFTDAKNMRRMFKKYVKQPPSSFRPQIQEEKIVRKRDRREYKRIEVNYAARITIGIKGKRKVLYEGRAKIKNISANGALVTQLENMDGIPVKNPFVCNLEILEGKLRGVRMAGEVVRIQNNGITEFGIYATQIHEEDKEKILEISSLN
jgi:AraC-like DNA-binding protein